MPTTESTMSASGELTLDLRHHADAEVAPGLTDLADHSGATAVPPWLRARVAESLVDLSRSPDLTPARAAVARRHGRDVGEVLLTPGAAAAWVLLARVLRPAHPVVVHPHFTEPEAALRAAGHDVERVVLTEEQGFRLDPAAVPDEADFVVVGNPANPTGVLQPLATLTALARPGRLLVVDETFADCVPGEAGSVAGRTDLPGLVVVRGLTKLWGLQGLRAGYLLAPAHLIDELATALPLWPLSIPALAALEECNTPQAVTEAREAAEYLAANRAYLIDQLRQVRGVRVVGVPRAAYVLLRVRDGERVRESLRAQGFAVRRGATFPGLTPNHLRVAVRDPDTSARFAAALEAVLP